MNTPNPLLPQGTLPPRGKSNLYFKILMIFAVHIVLLGGILMVGCKNTGSTDKAKTDATSDVAKSDPMSTPPMDPSPAPAPAGPTAYNPAPSPAVTTSAVMPAPAPAVTTVTPPVLPTPAPSLTPTATGGSVYVVAAGDILSTIAKKTGVSVKAIEDANPGLDPKKLQIKQKLQIPASTAVAATDSPKTSSDSTATASGDASIYLVKTGDVLGKIAKAHNTSVKTLEALNDMKTSAIKAGQKLKVPVMKMASADTAPAPAPMTPAPAPMPGAAPAPMVRAN